MGSFEWSYDPDGCRSHYDPESMPVSMAVIATLSKLTGRSPTDLPPLHEAVDTDALDEVFRNGRDSNGDISVTFSIIDHTVTVNAPDRITITEPSGNGSTAPNEEGTRE
ncbi:MAG: HalOD1 output domain-containing protein [Natronomonas sp.]